MYPDNTVLFMYIIPLKMKYLAWAYLGLTIYEILMAISSRCLRC